MRYKNYVFTIASQLTINTNNTVKCYAKSQLLNEPILIVKLPANANNNNNYDGIVMLNEYRTQLVTDCVYYSDSFSINPELNTLTRANAYQIDYTQHTSYNVDVWLNSVDNYTFAYVPHSVMSDYFVAGYVVPKAEYVNKDLYVYVYSNDVTNEFTLINAIFSMSDSVEIMYYKPVFMNVQGTDYLYEQADNICFSYQHVSAIRNVKVEDNNARYSLLRVSGDIDTIYNVTDESLTAFNEDTDYRGYGRRDLIFYRSCSVDTVDTVSARLEYLPEDTEELTISSCTNSQLVTTHINCLSLNNCTVSAFLGSVNTTAIPTYYNNVVTNSQVQYGSTSNYYGRWSADFSDMYIKDSSVSSYYPLYNTHVENSTVNGTYYADYTGYISPLAR